MKSLLVVLFFGLSLPVAQSQSGEFSTVNGEFIKCAVQVKPFHLLVRHGGQEWLENIDNLKEYSHEVEVDTGAGKWVLEFCCDEKGVRILGKICRAWHYPYIGETLLYDK